MNNWLLFYQTAHDTVRFISSDNEETSSLSYRAFIDYLPTFFVKDYLELKKELNKFKVILLDTKTGDWEIKKKENLKQYNFKELTAFNEQMVKKEELKNLTIKDQVAKVTSAVLENKNQWWKRK